MTARQRFKSIIVHIFNVIMGMRYDSAVVTAFFARTVSAERQRQRALPAVVMMPSPNKCFSFASSHAKCRKRVVPVCKPNPSQWKSFSLGICSLLFRIFFLLCFPCSQTSVSLTRNKRQKVLQTIIPNRQRKIEKKLRKMNERFHDLWLWHG